jgi:hypothetical protein
MLFDFNSSSAREMFVTFAIGRCSLAPAETLATTPVTPAARRSGDDYAVGARSVGGAQDCPEVMRIFDAVQYNDQRVFGAARGQQVVEVVVLLGGSDSDESLVRGVAGQLVEFGSRQEANLHADFAALVDHALETDVLAFGGDTHPLKVAASGFKRFDNGIDSVENVHGEDLVYSLPDIPL